MKSFHVKLIVVATICILSLWSVPSCTLFLETDVQKEPLEYCWTADKDFYQDGFLNYNITKNKSDGDIIITIYNGIFYFERSAMREALFYIISSDEGQKMGLDLNDIDYYVAEWFSHCIAYQHPELASKAIGDPVDRILERTLDVHLNLGDPYHDVYLNIYNLIHPEQLHVSAIPI